MSEDDFELPEVNDPLAVAVDEDPVNKPNKGKKTDWVTPGKKEEHESAQEAAEDEGSADEETPADNDDPTLKKPPETKAQPKFSQEELMEVFDSLMFKGEFVEEFTFREKMTFAFRSRTASETASISRRIDGLGFTMMPTIQQHYGLFNLAYSLIEYNDKSLRKMKAFPERYEFVCKLPSPVIDHLITKLNVFDHKIFKACEEGVENF